MWGLWQHFWWLGEFSRFCSVCHISEHYLDLSAFSLWFSLTSSYLMTRIYLLPCWLHLLFHFADQLKWPYPRPLWHSVNWMDSMVLSRLCVCEQHEGHTKWAELTQTSKDVCWKEDSIVAASIWLLFASPAIWSSIAAISTLSDLFIKCCVGTCQQTYQSTHSKSVASSPAGIF